MSFFTRNEIQDLEEAIYMALELISCKQESPDDYSKTDLKRMIKCVERLLKLKSKLAGI
jgi:HEPN domain-containing protein